MVDHGPPYEKIGGGAWYNTKAKLRGMADHGPPYETVRTQTKRPRAIGDGARS
jgi:hypothetical protein